MEIKVLMEKLDPDKEEQESEFDFFIFKLRNRTELWLENFVVKHSTPTQ